MILRQERLVRDAAVARIWTNVRLRLGTLGSEVLIGSPSLAAIGLVGIALSLQTIALSMPGHFRPAGAMEAAVLLALCTFLSLVVSFVATLPLRRLVSMRARQVLAGCALLSLLILSGVGTAHVIIGARAWIGGSVYSNDGAVMDSYAAQQVLRGHDPYVKQSIASALAAMNAPSTTTTPLMDGQFRDARAYPSPEAIQQVFLNTLLHRPRTIPPEFESKYNYPAGSFLFILPFTWAGIHDMRFLFVLALVAMGAYLRWRMPMALRPLAPFIMLSSVPLIILTAGGQPDPIYGVFLLIALAEWPSRWVSPLALGLAVATKQLAWFFVPFYLLFVAQRFGWREALRRTAIMAGIFLVTNGPFIARAPGAYIAGISGPMADPMFPLGIGFIAIFVSSVLPMLPKVAFSAIELAVWLGGVAAAARFRMITLAGSSVLAALPLFFAWRSLVNYFYLIPLLALAIVFADSSRRSGSALRDIDRRTIDAAGG